MPKPVGSAAEEAAELFTLGYEGLTPERYFDAIQAAGVTVLVDIRRTPMSRKPGFSKKRLGEAAALRGLEYVHMVALGTPRDVLYAYRADHNHTAFFKGMREYLDTQPDAIRELAQLAVQKPCCLLCVEADPNVCHRRIVSDYVQKFLGGPTHLHVENLTAPV